METCFFLREALAALCCAKSEAVPHITNITLFIKPSIKKHYSDNLIYHYRLTDIFLSLITTALAPPIPNGSGVVYSQSESSPSLNIFVRSIELMDTGPVKTTDSINKTYCKQRSLMQIVPFLSSAFFLPWKKKKPSSSILLHSTSAMPSPPALLCPPIL